MQLYNLRFTTFEKLRQFAERHHLTRNTGLIQIFSGMADTKLLAEITSELSTLLPDFSIIGTSTSGEISNDRLFEESILLSFSCFSSSHCEVRYYPHITEAAGLELGSELKDSDARLAIVFANALSADPFQFINGIATAAPDLCIAGGSAGDNARYQETYVQTGSDIHYSGMAVAIIYSKTLKVQSQYLMNWTPIGAEMEITRCAGNVIYELDNMPVIERYCYYLGNEVADNLPESVNAFPLLTTYDGVVQARDAIGRSSDGGMAYAGQVYQGQKVRFGVADINNILNKAEQLAQQIHHRDNTEAVYVYSCTGRKSFLQTYIEDELKIFSHCAPMAGFFTYGEYFHSSGNNRVLNITNTFVTLSENTDVKYYSALPEPKAPALAPSVLKSLTHLINTTAVELRDTQKLSEQYKFALDQAAVVTKCDPDGTITYLNEKYEELSGFPAEALYGKNVSTLFLPYSDSKVLHQAWQDALEKRVWRGTLRATNSDNNYFEVNCVAYPIIDSSGNLTEMIGIGADITEFINQQRVIEEQRTDRLTGLPSRAHLIEDLKEKDISLLAMVDVRAFKSINDYYGIQTGDELIRRLSDTLNRQARHHNIDCYRLYSAGFAFIPPPSMSIDELKSHMQSIAHYIDRNPVIIDDEVIDTELAVGISTGKSHLMAMAEAALQQAKHNSEHSIIPVLSSDSHDHLKNQQWLRTVKEALSEGRVICHYQVVKESKTGDQNYYEALVRIQNKDGSIVSPAAFLDVIKRTRYYPMITRQVIRSAIQIINKTPYGISVNLSAEDITNKDTLAFIEEQLTEHGGENLIFEITETESVSDYEQVRSFIRMIKRFGARISIDDFGSGYSNFSHLVELQPDFIKIDGTIISAILTDHKSLLVTESIIDLSHKIGAKVVAEYVSDDILETNLKMLGADYLQGFAIGKPAPL